MALAPYFLSAAFCAIGGAELWHQQNLEEEKQKQIDQIFLNAGIPQDQVKLVRDIVIKERGNCALLATDLQFACTIAKMQLSDAKLDTSLRR